MPDTTALEMVDLVNSLKAKITGLEEEISRVRQEMIDYKKRVREVAIEAKQSEGWCTSGFNSAMSDLDLPLYEQDFEVEVKVPAYQWVTVTVTAESEEEAREKIENGDVDVWDECSDTGSWDYDDDRDLEVSNVQAVSE